MIMVATAAGIMWAPMAAEGLVMAAGAAVSQEFRVAGMAADLAAATEAPAVAVTVVVADTGKKHAMRARVRMGLGAALVAIPATMFIERTSFLKKRRKRLLFPGGQAK